MSDPKPTMFFPMPKIYGVAQLDTEATLRDLTIDAEASVAAQKLRPLKCLVFLQNVRELPLPRKSEYKYSLYIVGVGLRPPNTELRITADMCIPIFPNTSHPDSDRANVVFTAPEFPFQNCYHWFGEDMELDVRVKKGEYMKPGNQGVYVLPSLQYVRMENFHQKDNHRVAESYKLFGAPPEVTPLAPAPGIRPLAAESKAMSDDREDISDDGQSVSVKHNEEGDSVGPDLPDNFFGWDHDAATEAMPIVDLWLDLPAHMSGDDIPDPVAFIQECNALSQIVRDLQRRQAAAEQTGNPEPVVAAGEDSPSLARQLPNQSLVTGKLFDSLKRILGGAMDILRARRRRSSQLLRTDDL